MGGMEIIHNDILSVCDLKLQVQPNARTYQCLSMFTCDLYPWHRHQDVSA
jgi:hypothetical protein